MCGELVIFYVLDPVFAPLAIHEVLYIIFTLVGKGVVTHQRNV